MPIGAVQNSAQSLLTQLTAAPKVSLFASYDPADTNQDGVVSPAERLAYDLSHPATATSQPLPSFPSYTQQGSSQTAVPGSLLNLNG